MNTKSETVQELERIEMLRAEVERKLAKVVVIASDEIGELEGGRGEPAPLRRLAKQLRQARYVLDAMRLELGGLTRKLAADAIPAWEGLPVESPRRDGVQ